MEDAVAPVGHPKRAIRHKPKSDGVTVTHFGDIIAKRFLYSVASRFQETAVEESAVEAEEIAGLLKGEGRTPSAPACLNKEKSLVEAVF